MKIIVISDSHGNIANLKNVLGFAKKINAGAIIHCGDWNNIKAVETVLESKIPLYSVLGNADVDPRVSTKLKVQSAKFEENFLNLELNGKKIGVIHKLTINHQPLTINHLDIIFYGHIHSQDENEINGVKIIRPGALENKINFAVFDTKTKIVEFIHE